MARRKFKRQRHELLSERSFQDYLTTPAPQTSRTELLALVRGGEDSFLELKVKLSNPERIAQGIVALANTGGGVIVFGVNDNLRVEGLDDPEAVRDELVRICREDVVPSVFPYIDIVSFDNGTSITADEVILCMSFSVLRTLNYKKAGFDALKQTAITELGSGLNAKLNLQFKSRIWNSHASTGSLYTDQPTSGLAYRWDATAKQYIYNWQTAKGDVGKVYRIGARLDDGTTMYVNIGLR